MPTTLTNGRRKLAQELGGFFVGQAASGTVSTAQISTAFRSSALDASELAYRWAFSPASAEMRQSLVEHDGLDATTGTISFADVLGTAVTGGTIIELHTHLPAYSTVFGPETLGSSDVMGLHECLNAALRWLDVERKVSLLLVDGQYDYPLTSLPSLDRPERLLDVRQRDATGTTYLPSADQGHPWEFRENVGGSHVLHFHEPYEIPSGSFSNELVILSPADTWISVGGTWAESTVGVVNESDQAGVDVNAWVAVAKAFAYAAIRDSLQGVQADDYNAMFEKQWAWVHANVRNFNADAPAPPPPPSAGPAQLAGPAQAVAA